ncbi:MAG: PfkB family carbohydrate kinase [Nakamurella sp.]
MSLTDRERLILALLRGNPMLTSDAIAARLNSTRAAVNVHLSNLGKKGTILGRGYLLADEPGVVVVGGANMDVKARSTAAAVAGTSNPGHAAMSPGGVGRNIAENLARLGTRVHLVASVGRDPLGDTLIRETSDAGVHLDYTVRTDVATGTYTAVLDATGELVVAVSDMAATAELSPIHIDAARDVIASADLLVLDGNLTSETLGYARNLGAAAGVRIIVESVSVPKAAALAALPGMFDPAHPLYLITPNRDEVTALTGLPAGTSGELRAAAALLHERGVRYVWIRLGGAGSLLSGPDGFTPIPAIDTDVVDVTGAGDSLLAAFCHALLGGADEVGAARYGHAAATLTIASPHTVRPDLTDPLVATALTTAQLATPSGPVRRTSKLTRTKEKVT